MSRNILVIAPHSDDAELGVGGYLHRERQKVDRIKIAVLASGAYTSTKSSTNVTSHTRQAEGRAAGVVLGIDDYDFLDVAPDSAFGSMPRGDLVKEIEQLVFGSRWDELFIPLPSFHSDHAVTYEACIAATRPHAHRDLPGRIYAYEYPGQAWGPAAPATSKVYAPLSGDDLGAKLEALAEHRSQWAADAQSLYGSRGVKALAELRGAECGSEAAELFYLLRARI
jgi:LmbE family N-acetylglucosaminyl deacetylase